MKFSDKYISEKENAENPDIKKIILSNDAYAIGEMIDELIKKVDYLRLK